MCVLEACRILSSLKNKKEVFCLLALSSGGATPSPPKEPKHFHHSHLKRKEISVTANLPYGRGARP